MSELRSIPSAQLYRRDWPAPLALSSESPVVSRNGRHLSVALFRELLDQFLADQPERIPPASDVQLAPLLHESLRLTRREASDKGMWAWLASTIASEYVARRWGNRAGEVKTNRYVGQINKQALARLWWGMELFRDGPDYPAWIFRLQDIPNSILHRHFVRNRPLSVTMHEALLARVDEEKITGGLTRPWFQGINLYGGTRDLPSLGFYHRDDAETYQRWVEERPRGDGVKGPPQNRVTPEARARAQRFLLHVWDSTTAAEAST